MARSEHTSGSQQADGAEPSGRGSSSTYAVPCAICGHTGGRVRSVHHMTHGVSVWLCEAHGNEGFLRKDNGTVFTQSLAGMWIASGVLTERRMAALRAHVRQTQFAGADRDQPGSYSWPLLRREAEQRFAAGHDPNQVIRELRDRHRDCPAMAPSTRTMRRWYTQSRWLEPCPSPTPKPAGRHPRLPVPVGFELIPYALTKHLYLGYYRPPRRGP